VTQEELVAPLAEGLASDRLEENEFWDTVDRQRMRSSRSIRLADGRESSLKSRPVSTNPRIGHPKFLLTFYVRATRQAASRNRYRIIYSALRGESDMADINLTQSEADALITMEKVRVDDKQWDFPAPGDRIAIPLTSADKRENFLLDVTRAQLKLTKATYQNRARQAIILMRLDLDGRLIAIRTAKKFLVLTCTCIGKASVINGRYERRFPNTQIQRTFFRHLRHS
jgi:hypothetical protein